MLTPMCEAVLMLSLIHIFYAENRKLLQENGRLREELARLRPFSLGAG